MPLFQNRAGRFDNPPSSNASFPTVPAGARVGFLAFGGLSCGFYTETECNAETLCDYIETHFARYITPECGLDAITKTGDSDYTVAIGR